MAGSREPIVEEGGTDRRAEPRSPTIADSLAIVAGFGIALSLRHVLNSQGYLIGFAVPIWLIVLWCSVGILFATALATASAVVVRQMMFRRPARAAEWLAILLGLLIFREALPELDDLVNRWLPPDWPAESFGKGRWIIASVGTALSLAGLTMLGLLRRWLPHASITMILAGSILGLLWGPIPVVEQEVPWLIPSPAMESTSTGVFWAWLEIRKYIGLIPMGLLFGIPATAALEDWKVRASKGRLWTEWPGPAIGLVLVLVWLVFLYLVRSEWPPQDLNAERVVVPFWIAGVWWVSRWVVEHLGATWHRRLMPVER
ncbi:MAG: hypothetical protein ACLQGP_30650 [Isosphaeraceae bacterium]